MKLIAFALHWALVGLGAAVLLSFGLQGLSGTNHWTGLRELFASPVTGYANAVTRAAPAVVSIRALSDSPAGPNPLTDDPVFRQFFGDETRGAGTQSNSSLGSGVILDSSGVILSNYHVIKGSDTIRVELHDGRVAAGIAIGTDADTDLAVLKISLDELPSVTLGDSNATKVGDIVLAIGNALGIGQTVTQGIVSATGRSRIGINTFENFIQTDAAINFGNSGGALINTAGELIGINSARVESEGIGFAIPTSIALPIARQILDFGRVERGWLGLDARDLSDSLKRMLGVQQGIVVLEVLEHGPAAMAGVVASDVFTHLGEHSITDSRTAMERIASFKPGSTIALRGVRNGQAFKTMVTISQRPPQQD
jgi:serine protease DegS